MWVDCLGFLRREVDVEARCGIGYGEDGQRDVGFGG